MERKLSERTLKKHAKEKAEIDQQMMKFGELPSDYDSFVTDTVLVDVNYIFYSSKEGSAYCTKCGSEFNIRKENHLKHNSYADCPVCKKTLVCKSKGMSRHSLFCIEWSVLVQASDENVLVRYFRHTRDFRADYRNSKEEIRELYRTIHTVDRSYDYEWTKYRSTNEYRWCKYKDPCGWGTPSEFIYPRKVVLYNKELSKDIAGTCMQYSAVDIYASRVMGVQRKYDNPWWVDWYFNTYRRKPYIEQLLKVGFYRLANEILVSYYAPKFTYGRSVCETLGISKEQFRILRKLGDPCLRDLNILKYGQHLSKGEVEILRSISDNRYAEKYKTYIDMRRYTTIYRLNRYLCENGLSEIQQDYFDYIGWLKEMGYDMRNKSNLYPKNFRKAHDEKAKEYIRYMDQKAKEDREKFDLLLKELRENAKEVEAMNLSVEGLFVRLPYRLDEIKKEGEMLHHCVGTYVDKVAKVETAIFFVRRVCEPDKSYYTMEWKNNRIIQCRGFKNCDMTPEVRAFATIFEEKMQKNAAALFDASRLRSAS